MIEGQSLHHRDYPYNAGENLCISKTIISNYYTYWLLHLRSFQKLSIEGYMQTSTLSFRGLIDPSSVLMMVDAN